MNAELLLQLMATFVAWVAIAEVCNRVAIARRAAKRRAYIRRMKK